MRRALPISLAALVLAAAGVAAFVAFRSPDAITIRVEGIEQTVDSGTTLGDAAKRFALHALAGDLLDVQGDILDAHAYPGHILVNGGVGPSTTELAEGDVLRVVDGRSRREPTTVSYVRVRAGMAADPQFTLARTPGEQEFERGQISGKIVPLGFHASGPTRTPKAVALTFDDGPSRYTRRILAVLERMHVRATFFVVGVLAKQYPGVVRKELAAGMEVGSHSYSHPYRPPFDRQPHKMILQEISRGRSVLADLGRAPTVFRPPGGSFSPYVIEASGSYGQRVVLWSVDPTDWKAGTKAKQIVRRVLKAVRPGSIVVLHDGGGDRTQTARALPQIIRGIRRKGLALTMIDPG